MELETGRPPRCGEGWCLGQCTHPLGRRPAAGDAARRFGIEDPPAGQRLGRGLAAQHEPVAGTDGHGPVETEDRGRLPVAEIDGVASVSPDDTGHPGGPDVDRDRRPIGRKTAERRTRPQRDEQPIRRDDARVGRQHGAPLEAVDPPARDVQGNAPRTRSIDRPAVDLDLARPDGTIVRTRDDAEHRAALDRNAAEGARDDRPAAANGEHAIDREAAAGRGVSPERPGRAVARPVAHCHQGGEHRLETVTAQRGDGHDRRSAKRRRRHERPHLLDDLVDPSRARDVGLRHDDQAVVDPERVEQLEVLAGLGSRPVVGGDHQQRRVDLARPDEHVADQPVVPGNIDEVELGPVFQDQVRVPDVDRHPAGSLLGQPIGVDPGQRPEQARLAVIDVTGGPDDDRHDDDAARPAMRRAIVASSNGDTVRRSNAIASSTIRARIRSGPVRRSAADRVADAAGTETPADGRTCIGSEPPPTGDSSSTTRRSVRPASVAPWSTIHFARARRSSGVRAIICQTGMSVVARPAR